MCATVVSKLPKVFDRLVGEWDTVATHRLIAGEIRGRASFEWIRGGQFLIWRTENPPNTVPSAIAIIGGEESTPGVWPMSYFDERGVSRVYHVTSEGDTWRLWRDDPGFSQRGTAAFEEDGAAMRLRFDLDNEGGKWKRDLEVVYRRKMGRESEGRDPAVHLRKDEP